MCIRDRYKRCDFIHVSFLVKIIIKSHLKNDLEKSQ
ncbi:hypothetical protein A5853_001862 [Enterococcus faecium]|nr:hypothetical protein A5853_001862 [Enterococcus faecium]